MDHEGHEHHHHEMKKTSSCCQAGHEHLEHHAQMIEDFKKRFWISILLTIPIMLLTPMIQEWLGLGMRLRFPGDMYILFALSTAVFIYGGYPFTKGLIDELNEKSPGMMTLIAIAISVAYLYSSIVVFGLPGSIFFWELATLIDIMLLGHWIEMGSVMGASRALEEMAKLLPSDAHKIMPDGSVKDVSLEEIIAGDMVIVKPGEKIPADGEVVNGETSVDESLLTGESKPVSKKAGSKVIGGSVNSEGSITVKIEKTGSDSFISQVVELVKQAQESKSKTQDLADRAAVWLTFIALASGLATLIAWIIASRPFSYALERTVTVMVITCPHALGLAIPLVVAVSTAIAAKNGIIIRQRNAFEKAKDISAVIFDKTGTLTEGKFGVTDIIIFGDVQDEDELLKYAASVESRSEHSIAKTISSSSGTAFAVEQFKSIPGKGVQGLVNGKEVKVVSPGYLKENNISYKDEQIEKLFSQGKTVVFVLINAELAGAIALADQIRAESKEAVSRLKETGIRCIMLTGDNRQVAEWVATELGMDEYHAEILPQQKAEKVKKVQSRGFVVAMAGDGVNDAPSLAQADVGIAMGAGTDVAIETADIILVKSDPLDIVTMIALARATYSKMIQNLVWATGYNAFAIPLAAGVLFNFGIMLSPAAGAVLMSFSTVIVAINARFLKIKKSSGSGRSPL